MNSVLSGPKHEKTSDVQSIDPLVRLTGNRSQIYERTESSGAMSSAMPIFA